jgi:hypothetical protein
MAATNEQLQQAVESFFLLFNGVVVFCKLLKTKKIESEYSICYILVMSFGYTLIESGGVRSQNAGHSLFKTLLIFSKFHLMIKYFEFRNQKKTKF